MECAVCYELTPDVVEKCGHVLCHVCFAKWKIMSSTCPVCRGPLECSENLMKSRKIASEQRSRLRNAYDGPSGGWFSRWPNGIADRDAFTASLMRTRNDI